MVYGIHHGGLDSKEVFAYPSQTGFPSLSEVPFVSAPQSPIQLRFEGSFFMRRARLCTTRLRAFLTALGR